MKGKLIKKSDNWYVIRVEEGDWETYYPLHPADIEQIDIDAKIFDNIEARIKAYPDVEFEIIEECNNYNHFGKDCSCKTNFTPYAKLIVIQ